MNVSRTMTPLEPNSAEWLAGVVIGAMIVGTSLGLMGGFAFQTPPVKEDRVVISAPAPRKIESNDEPPPPPPPGGEATPQQPDTPKEQPRTPTDPTPTPTSTKKDRRDRTPTPNYPQPVPVPMPSDDEPGGQPGGEPGGVPGGTPGGTPGGEGTGPTEAQKAAAAAYKRTIANFFSRHYQVTGTGLDPDELAKRKVKAVVEVNDDLTIVGYEVKSSGFAEFDEAARKTLEAVKGKQLPLPPPDFTGPVGPKLNITLICRPGQCD